MQIEEVRSKTDAELRFELAGMKKEYFELRFKRSTETLQSPARIRVLRRGIARVNTILHERRMGVRGQEVNAKDPAVPFGISAVRIYRMIGTTPSQSLVQRHHQTG